MYPTTQHPASSIHVQVSTKEVTDKLKGLGIDLDNNRFLILQVSRSNSRGTDAGHHQSWLQLSQQLRVHGGAKGAALQRMHAAFA